MTEQQRDIILKDIASGGKVMSSEIIELLPDDEERKMIKLTIKFYQKRKEVELYNKGVIGQKKDVVEFTNYYNLVKKYEHDSNIPQSIKIGFFIDRDGIVHNINMKGGIKNG